MGEMRDPRFLPALHAAFRTGTAKHRATVLRALSRIRRRLSDCGKAGSLRVFPASLRVAADGSRSLLVAVNSAECGASSLRAVQFVIYENGRQALQYSVAPQPDPDLLVAGFVVPRILSHSDPYAIALERGLNACLGAKRPQDIWAFDRYACSNSDAEEVDTGPFTDPDPAILNHARRNQGMLVAPEIIAKVIPGPGRRDQASLDIGASAAKVIDLLIRVATGAHHLFLCFEPDAPPSVEEVARIEAAAAAAIITIHGIVPDTARDMSAIRDICRKRGTFHRAPVETIGTPLAGAVEGLLQRYAISYTPESPAPDPVEVKVQVFSDMGCGEAVFEN
jgi:hypothetical protein